MQGRKFWMSVALVTIWLAVLAASLFAPDFVSGSYQEHLPLAAIITWLFGVSATRAVLKMMSRPKVDRDETHPAWMRGSIAVAAIWVLVAIFSIYGPVNVTGSDPTRFPIGVLIAPIAGSVLTGLVGQLFDGWLEA